MNYTKAFEKYWGVVCMQVNKKVGYWQSSTIKEIAFRAWKAGIDKTKRDYGLIKHKNEESSKFLPF